MKKLLYWRMYQDKESTGSPSVILNLIDMKNEAKQFFENSAEGDLPPLFEPIMLFKEEFESLPEFDGF